MRRELGAGGMASVYLAVQTSLDREVALKVMAPALAVDPTFSKRFLQEARMLASLAHPNIVQVYDVGVTQTQLNYFSMQHLSGGDFAQRVRIGLSEKDLVRVLEGVANALGYAHQRGYVHRDVAPGNILFDVNDTPVLTDFGIARAISQAARITSAGISIGTSHYMSPEQARGGDVDARSDLYGLGVLTWFGLTGKPPYEGADGFAVSYAHVFEPIPRLPPAQAHWQPIIDKALAKDPADRYQSADEFVAALSRFDARAAAPAPAPEAEAPTRVIKRDAVAAAAAARATAEPAARAHVPATEPAPSVVDAAPAPAGKRWIPVVLAIVGALVVAGVGYAVFAPKSSTTTAAVRPAPAKPAPEAPRPVDTPVATAPSPPPPADPAAGTTAAPVISDTVASTDVTTEATDVASEEPLDLSKVPTVVDPVVELVRLARADLAGQRLTNPPRTNAFERFSLALRIDAKSKPAAQGVVDTARAYVDLAEKAWTAGNPKEFTDFLAKAEEVAATVPDGAATVAAARTRRTTEVDAFVAQADAAALAWDKDAARAAYEKALVLDAKNTRARDALRTVDRIGAPGFVFRDTAGDGKGPELVVTSTRLAFARRETTRAEFARWWAAAGQRQFGGKEPSCRDRESVFRSSRKRTWQVPGFDQDDTHPVVCVSFAQAAAYAQWLSTSTGKRYRLATAAEWDSLAKQAPAGSCTSANLADAAFRKAFDTRAGAECDDGFSATSPAGRFPAVAGVFDIDGNAREWIAACGKSGALAAGCREHGVRGRGWMSPGDREGVTESNAYGDDVAMNTLGFRVVREIDP
ncbi:bifunctional serine/threonine-protein kinase/formylglycine-generating enzyme family protein [Dokdonella sp. MW10]|uniref:bifunctional serine/threonine-protein kinase/formylglycine-generating enzyme family protein n=1 Tax=Dokdonella sp. MW10 TaxID=2992926 RepID=UPI003F800A02